MKFFYKRIVVVIFICVCCLSIGNYVNQLLAGNLNVNDSVLNNVVGLEIDYSISKDTIQNNEEFSLVIRNSSGISIREMKYDIVGFKVTETLELEKDNSLEYILGFDGESKDCDFILVLYLEDGSSYEIAIYGFLYNDILYISTLSRDTAIKNAYKNEYEGKSLDEEQYLDMLQNLSNEAIGYQKIINIAGDLKEDESKSGNTFVNGTLEWEDDVFNINHPLQFVKWCFFFFFQ
jgi:hypothetical protein